MRPVRIYVAQIAPLGREFPLPESVVAHVVRVLRLSVGAQLQLFNGDGHVRMAEITRQDKRGSFVTVTATQAATVESALDLTLIQGISRGERMDYTIQKAVELGVTRIVPVITERCGVQLDTERWQKKQEHWQSIVHSACEQCGRNVVPDVAPVRKLDLALADCQADRRLLLDPQAQHSLATSNLSGSIALLAGPEGGLSEHDLVIARSIQFVGVRLGPRVLRTETAALVALSALQVLVGDLR